MPILTLVIELQNLINEAEIDVYEVEVASYQSATMPTYNDPGDGGEVEMGAVTVKRQGAAVWEQVADSVLFEHYAMEYDLKDDPPDHQPTYSRQTSLQKANEAITERLFECAEEYYSDCYEDREPFNDD